MNTSSLTTLNRRKFLKASAITGVGFSIGMHSVAMGHGHSEAAEMMGHFVKVGSDNTVTVIIKHLDKGQGVTTGLTAIVAEEMNADWEQMRWEFAPADATKYNNLFWGPYQGTGGSTAVANSWMQLRQAGAAAKQMLVQAAAKAWGVAADSLSVDKGVISDGAGKSVSFGDVAKAAALETVPQEPALKSPDTFTLLGTHIERKDSFEKTHGTAQYTIDVRLPGMLYAAILHPPTFGAKVKALDTSKAKAIAGVKSVQSTPRGIAVLADNNWAARKGKEALIVDWDVSGTEQRSSEELWQHFSELGQTPGTTVVNEGDFAAAQKDAATTVEMELEFPYLAHATMEPLNCVVDLKDNECHIYTGSQIPSVDVYVASQVTGLKPEQIFIHTQYAGGSFGRRAVPDSDFVMEAVMIAKGTAGAAPISLQWSREDDMKAGRYRPMAKHKFAASIDKNGELSGWHHRVVSQSILRGTPFEGLIQGPIDMAITEGGANLPYAIANRQFEAHEAQVGVPVLWWRSVGHSHNAYATEVFFDEVAHKMGQDPAKLRQRLLQKHPRHLAVLNRVLEASNWGTKLEENVALGVAVHESFASFVAQVAKVRLNPNRSFQIEKIYCAVDCGFAVTPDVVRAQMEGGIGYGLSAVLGEAITLDKGRATQNNFYDYNLLRLPQMPEIEVHIVNSGEAPTGVGEPGTPPAGPAVANALRVLTGKPLTKLPIGNTV